MYEEAATVAVLDPVVIGAGLRVQFSIWFDSGVAGAPVESA